MRILYVSQYFPPEMGAPAARVHGLSKRWVEMGHEVTVLTGFAHHPTGVKARRDRWKLTRREELDGIDVVRAYVYATPNQGTVKRMASYVSFMLSAILVGMLRVKRPEVVIATSPQLLCGLAGYLLGKALGAPFVFEVRDLWPETMVAVDVMDSEHLVVRGLRRLSAFLYERSAHIVTVGEGYAASIRELYGVDQSRMSVVHNGVDLELFEPAGKHNGVRRQYGWNDRFVLMYVGTHGMCHGLGSVIEVARRYRDDARMHFVLVGEGAEKEQLQRTAAEWQLPNVQFIGGQPRDRIAQFYAACDAGIVCLRKSTRFHEVLPSKIFEYLGMERPIVLGVDGEARRLVERSGAGVCVPPEDAEAMAAAVEGLWRRRHTLAQMGRAGRDFVIRHFDRGRLASKYVNVLEAVLAEYGRTRRQVPRRRSHARCSVAPNGTGHGPLLIKRGTSRKGCAAE